MGRTRRVWTWWTTCAVAGFVTLAVGGGIMLFNDTSVALWSVGLNLLVVGLLAVLVSAVGEWLASSEAAASSGADAPVAISDVPLARLIFVVRRDRRDLYEQLQATVARQENVQVVIDRRDRPRDAFDREVVRRGWSVARVGA